MLAHCRAESIGSGSRPDQAKVVEDSIPRESIRLSKTCRTQSEDHKHLVESLGALELSLTTVQVQVQHTDVAADLAAAVSRVEQMEYEQATWWGQGNAYICETPLENHTTMLQERNFNMHDLQSIIGAPKPTGLQGVQPVPTFGMASGSTTPRGQYGTCIAQIPWGEPVTHYHASLRTVAHHSDPHTLIPGRSLILLVEP